jgi:hypothetical protein
MRDLIISKYIISWRAFVTRAPTRLIAGIFFQMQEFNFNAGI